MSSPLLLYVMCIRPWCLCWCKKYLITLFIYNYLYCCCNNIIITTQHRRSWPITRVVWCKKNIFTKNKRNQEKSSTMRYFNLVLYLYGRTMYIEFYIIGKMQLILFYFMLYLHSIYIYLFNFIFFYEIKR